MNAPLWSSGFRPFFLMGTAYGPIILIAGLLPLWGVTAGPALLPPELWHGHELIYGFASAFICGFVLTALPSWAGTREVKGGPLIVLAVIWIAGRIASWCYGWLPVGVIGGLDLLLFATLGALVLPGLLRVIDRRYLALLPILLGFLVADAAYYLGIANEAFEPAQRALLLALNVLVVLFAIVSGLLTPVFTETALQGRGETVPFRYSVSLEAAAIASVLLFAAADWAGVPPALNGAIACLAAIVHAARLSRWHSAAALTIPLVFAMHVGYAWLVVAMALRGLADAFALVPRNAWIHAFTVGALGMTMLSFANRVVLRHTGRIAETSPLALAGLIVMFSAGIARVAASLFNGSTWWMAISACAWALPFLLFLLEHGAKLWRRSLPRVEPEANPSTLLRFEP
jgi:uncharacterized protein involved in response to NO